ncbi:MULTISPECIES: hypothetical protein [Bacillus]|jgi:hypothetical protein|uniref:Uncharacterized protein n=2 Tax=Bacillus cereus TaxID=1396 RepID=Q814D2_BACCR|nr:hypothetical protein [Bacillus cereus]AAP12364.1 hypothetical protein BC_p0020 [Bacillus cereus ATCC 14579]MCC3289172.1 hypothetical protein [Bacillus cereus]OOR43314.1 hypothetical protein BW896_25015 [Bacillus cereus]QCX97445.1 hypothetical protein EJ379_28130 [Bacillus cereus ATCC 14579]WPD83345.1 hypothetical protein R8N76_28110 [Bacillus cereus ATCC 14579]
MALQITYGMEVFGKQLDFPKAYLQIVNINGDKTYMTVQVILYDDDQKGNVINRLQYGFKPSILDSAPNYHKQGYEYMKTLPEFKNAIDILEEGQI